MKHLALILEFVSFYMVTLDLYGEERLSRLTERIHRWLPAMQRSIEKRGNQLQRLFLIWKKIQEPFRIAIMSSVIIAGCFVILEQNHVFGKKYDFIFIAAERPVLAIVSVAAPLFVFCFISLVVSAILLSLLWYCTAASLFLVRSIKMDGMLLISGTMLFTASKVITFFYD